MTEENRFEADKCIEVAELHIFTGNIDRAERLALKAQRLFPSDKVKQLLEKIGTEKEFSEKSKDKNTMYTSKGNTLNNVEDAERCIEVAQTAIFAGQIDKARRMLKKAERFYPSNRAKDLLRQIEDQGESQNLMNAINRNPKKTVEVKTPVERPKRETTKEQIEAMARVNNAKNSYEVLGLPRQCDLKQVKKAYRRLTLLLHPDKNREPGAKETFMIVIGAMEELSRQKKKQENSQ